MRYRLLPLSAIVFASSSTWAQPCSPDERAVIVADDGAEFDGYGWSVAIDGHRAIVGSLNDDAHGTDSGSVYILEYDGSRWDQVDKIVPLGIGAFDGFGDSVAISADTIVIGSPGDDDAGSNAGAAYVYNLVEGQWVQITKIVPDGLLDGDNFASSVDIDNGTIVLSAMLDDEGGSNSGKAYIYRLIDGVWGFDASIMPDDIEEFDRFAGDVSVSGNRILAGSVSDDDLGESAGAAYVFTRVDGVWEQTIKLIALDGAADDQFGERVDLDGDSLIIGARYDDDMGSRSGSAYIFEFNGTQWAEHTKLVAFDGANSEYFGQDIAIRNGRAIVGAWGQNDPFGFFNAGAAYAYSRTNGAWSLDTKLAASDQEGGDFYGYGVAISDEFAIIGADGNDDFWWGADVGAVYMIELNCMGAECRADISGDGVLDAFDVFGYIKEFNSMNPIADFTEDGVFDIFDVFAFIEAFNDGCP